MFEQLHIVIAVPYVVTSSPPGLNCRSSCSTLLWSGGASSSNDLYLPSSGKQRNVHCTKKDPLASWLVEMIWKRKKYTVQCHYNAVNFLTNIHKQHPMGCLLKIQHLVDILPQFLWLFMQYLTILNCIIIIIYGTQLYLLTFSTKKFISCQVETIWKWKK